jgi:hypothetical protein
MLTLPNKYKYAAKTGQTERIWLFQLYYGAGSSFLPMATKDITVGGVFYPGIVIDPGVIQSKIDLIQCTAATSDLSFTCSDIYKNGKLSAQLYGGTNDFINRNVNVYIGTATSTTLSDYILVYQGRYTSTVDSGNSIEIYTTHRKPTDNKKIVQGKTLKKTYIPVIYGTYNPTDTGYWHQAAYTVFPCPYDGIINNNSDIVLNNPAIVGTNYLYYYDSACDRFIKLDDTVSTIYAPPVGDIPPYYKKSIISKYLNRTINTRAGWYDSTYNVWYLPNNAWDYYTSFSGNPATRSYYPSSGSFSVSGASQTFLLSGLEVPGLDGKMYDLKSYANVAINIGSITNYTGTAKVALVAEIYGASALTSFLEANTTGSHTSSSAVTDLTSKLSSGAYQYPSHYRIKANVICGVGDSITGTVSVYDSYYQAKLKESWDTDPETAATRWANMKFLYSGGDGYTCGFTGGSGVARYPHDIFRDMLYRFAGVNYADSALEGWSALDTARTIAAWDCRWWTNEEVDLEKTLNQLQLEGCFIFTYKPDGGKFIFIKNSYSSGDVSATLTNNDINIDSLTVSHSALSSLVTGFDLDYFKHPAKPNIYRGTIEVRNATAASKWNFGTIDIKKYNLDFLVSPTYGTATNDSFGNYQGFLQNNPKIIVDTEIINPAMDFLEVGDIIKFNLTDLNVFGNNWADLYFMIISTDRNGDGMKIKAEEVYSV